jgi:hypothetical protein
MRVRLQCFHCHIVVLAAVEDALAYSSWWYLYKYTTCSSHLVPWAVFIYTESVEFDSVESSLPRETLIARVAS